MKRIYLDHSATTPVDKKVLRAMMPYFQDKFGNPSSIHSFGQQASKGVEDARLAASKFLNCAPDEIIFTSGATEANNLAIKGIVGAIKKKNPGKKIRAITSVIEHDSVLEPFSELERSGVEVIHLPVTPGGVIKLEELRKAIDDDTALVSLMYVNSEVGSIQPIREAGKIIHKHNEQRLKKWLSGKPASRGEKPEPVYFHTDATQAVNFLNCDTKHNFLDALSLSAHKIYGPKGVGLLYLKNKTPISAQATGGHHELNRRSGTLNVPGIVGLGAALSQLSAAKVLKNNARISRLRDSFIKKITARIPDAVLNTDLRTAAPGHAHFSFLGVEGESILIALDLEGIAVSTGSACASNRLKASHVLVAMGIPVEIAHNSIRFTLGKYNSEKELSQAVRQLEAAVKKLRKISTEYRSK